MLSPRQRDLVSNLGLGATIGALPWLFYAPAAAYQFWYTAHALQALHLVGCGAVAHLLIAAGFALLPRRGPR